MDVTKSVTAAQIAEFLGVRLLGDDLTLTSAVPIAAVTKGAVSFANKFDEGFLQQMNAVRECLVIAAPEYHEKAESTLILSDCPRLDFLRVVERFFAPERPIGIDPSAFVHPEARLGEEVFLGRNAYIGPGVEIGRGSAIHHNVVVAAATTLGENCVVKSNAVLGEEGFGFEYNDYGVPEHFPHLGTIEIGDGVWIGACSTVERATLDRTVIESETKIDDLVQIGHNSTIGRNTLIMAGSIVCGGAIVGRNCWIAPNTTIREKVRVGEGVYTGLGTVVTEDLEPNIVVVGVPARKIRDRS